MTKISIIIGARPQFIKAAAVPRAANSLKKAFAEVIVHTGQHFDHNMSEVLFRELETPRSDYNLCIGGAPMAKTRGG